MEAFHIYILSYFYTIVNTNKSEVLGYDLDMENLLRLGEKLIPRPLYKWGQPVYHWKMAFLGALLYGFPSRKIKVIGVTGTKGKSSTTEIINTILEEAGYKTAVSNTIRFKVGSDSRDNMYKMSMPGRFFIQKFLKEAVDAKCDFVIMEMTSQGSLQYRHKFIDMDAFVFTNISPEHIEAHGSFEKYVEAKIKIAEQLGFSSKKNRALIVNADDRESRRFLSCAADEKISFSIKDVMPYEIKSQGINFTLNGKPAYSPLSGLFNLYNILAAINTARHFGVSDDVIKQALEKFNGIKGRVEKIEAGQDFTVVVDYAHTPDSLQKLFEHFKNQRIIAVFGATGGGRDTWKRKEMGKIADTYASEIILTDDDSYDEDPQKICEEIKQGITHHEATILVDRCAAIREAFRRAKTGDAVLITGKGTDPYLMGPRGTKIPWSDAKIARELLGSN
jgi:UDP-N-acetylmuramoyl-L-alanyl-D-glutamate--2,6-diaminopimelate ligase